MNELALAYLQQARSDFQVFELLCEFDRAIVPECHPLHYLQMATEKLAKAAILQLSVEGFDRFSHVAFSLLPYQLNRNDVARALGWPNSSTYRVFLRKAAPAFRRIDELNPSVGPQQVGGGLKEGPNSEYPWLGRNDQGQSKWHIPATTEFGLLEELRQSSPFVQVLPFIRALMSRFDTVFK